LSPPRLLLAVKTVYEVFQNYLANVEAGLIIIDTEEGFLPFGHGDSLRVRVWSRACPGVGRRFL